MWGSTQTIPHPALIAPQGTKGLENAADNQLSASHLRAISHLLWPRYTIPIARELPSYDGYKQPQPFTAGAEQPLRETMKASTLTLLEDAHLY